MIRRVVVLACLLVASSAHAEDRTTVFPFTATGMPAHLSGASAAMTRALAVMLGGEVANVPIDDVTGLLSCNVELTDCLEQIAGSVNARMIVYGTITARGDRFEVDLVRFAIGPEREQRKIVLTARTERALATELVDKAGRMFGITPARTDDGPGVASDDDSDTEPMPVTEPPRRLDSSQSGPTAGSYVLIGAGVIGLGVGTAFIVSAYAIQNDVEVAPTGTLGELQALADLEDRGRTRMMLGIGLASAGGILAIVGIARAAIEKRDQDAERSAVVQPWISGRGLGVAVSWRLR